LVALNRLGFGARGGRRAIRQRSLDPPRFVKAELNRPNGGLLEVPTVIDPGIGERGVAYQLRSASARRRGEIRRARVRTAPPSPETKRKDAIFRSTASR